MSECIDHGRTKSLSPDGYALVGIPGKRSRCVGLHRLVYASTVHSSLDGIKGLVVRHTCDNPRCINPQHLIGGTIADNNRDRAERDRSAKRVPSRQKLTKEDCAFIQKHHKKRHPEYGTVALAKRFAVDSAVIIKVIKGTYCVINTDNRFRNSQHPVLRISSKSALPR